MVSKRVVLADVPGPQKTRTRVQKLVFLDPSLKPERGHKKQNDGTKSRNEGTFTKTTLLQNRPFVSSQKKSTNVGALMERRRRYAEKRSSKSRRWTAACSQFILRLSVWRLPVGAGVFHAKGWWSESSFPPSKVCFPRVSKGENLACPEFCRDVLEPWQCSKSLLSQRE